MKKTRLIKISVISSIPLILVLAFFIFVGARKSAFSKLVAAEPVAFEQKKIQSFYRTCPTPCQILELMLVRILQF